MSLIDQFLGSSATPTDDAILPWLCLAFASGVGPKSFQAILRAGISPKDIFHLDEPVLKSLGLNSKSIAHLRSHPPESPSKPVEAAIRWSESSNHHLICLSDPAYPERLKHIGSPPPVLMIKGQLEVLQQYQLAIVGSRHPTASGAEHGRTFAAELADAGMVITSGLAKGIDAYAHQGALDVGGATIAVLGTGLGHIYPKQHGQLADEICEKGALVSEFPLDTKPFQGNFPRRNRIVSGLALGTLVVEAALKSGSLITARQALEQNREVFAIPGSISNGQKAGCHYLIRQGAVLVDKSEQILEELADIIDYAAVATHSGQSSLAQPSASTSNKTKPMSENPHEQQLLKALDYDGASVDQLVARSSMSVSDITPLLMMMELKGWVRHEDGEYKLV